MLTRYLLPVLAAVAFSFAVIQMTKAQQQPPPVSPPVDPGKSPFGKQVAGAGVVEPETENIAVGSHVPGVVKAIYVRVDDKIAAGTPLFDLDDRHISAELAVRQATRDNAAAQVAKLDAMPRREELPPLEAKIEESKANLNDKLKLFERAKREAESGVGAGETFDLRKMAVDVARAQLRRVEAELDLTRAGAWEYDVALARATLAQAQAQCGQTKTELERLRVNAPRIRRPGADRTREPIPASDLVGLQQFPTVDISLKM